MGAAYHQILLSSNAEISNMEGHTAWYISSLMPKTIKKKRQIGKSFYVHQIVLQLILNKEAPITTCVYYDM